MLWLGMADYLTEQAQVSAKQTLNTNLPVWLVIPLLSDTERLINQKSLYN
jgi:hypothetical protein